MVKHLPLAPPLPPSVLLLSACWIMVVVQENSLRTSPPCLHLLRPTSAQNFAEMLPPEMSVQIFGELDAVSLCSASQTCRLWHHIIETSEQLWRKQCVLIGAVCQREVDGDRRDGLSWKVSPHRRSGESVKQFSIRFLSFSFSVLVKVTVHTFTVT